MSCSNGGVSKATNMDTSRRLFLTGCLGTAASACFGQGVATRKATAQPRGKSSGLPFDARFQDVTARAGLRQVTVYGGVDRKDYIIEVTGCGCAFLDYDNDGWLDVFIPSGVRLSDTPEGTSNRLYKNNRDGTFTDVTKESGLLKTGWAGGVCVGDYNNDGFEDLFVTYWGHNVIYHNNGDGTFVDVSAASGVAAVRTSYGFTAIAADFDDDGWPDIFVACDSTPSLLFMNNHDGTFREEGAIRGVAFSEDGQEQGGMGAAVGDYDLDGRLDILKTNFMDDTSNLYHNLGKATFEDATRRAGLGVENRFVSWAQGSWISITMGCPTSSL